MPPRAISSPSRYRAAGVGTPAGMPAPPARSAAAGGSSVVAARSLARSGSSRGYSGTAVPSPKLQATRVAILTHDPAGRRDAAGTGDLCFPQCEAPGRRAGGLVDARGGSPHGAPESGWLGFLAFQGPSSPIAVDHGGVREKAAPGPPGRKSERYHCPPDDFSRPKQIDVLVDLIERDRLDRVADLPLCSKGHDLAQVGVAAPERAVKGLFTRNPREQRD